MPFGNGRLSVSISLEEKMSLAQCADGNPDRSLIDGWSSALRDHWLRNYLCVRLFYSDGLQSCCVCGEGGACREGNRWFITLVPKSWVQCLLAGDRVLWHGSVYKWPPWYNGCSRAQKRNHRATKERSTTSMAAPHLSPQEEIKRVRGDEHYFFSNKREGFFWREKKKTKEMEGWKKMHKYLGKLKTLKLINLIIWWIILTIHMNYYCITFGWRPKSLGWVCS